MSTIDSLYKFWLDLMDNTVIPFLRSKPGMWIILGVILWIIIY